jgi:dihydrofolate synthase/folylpolyglutamate synthase
VSPVYDGLAPHEMDYKAAVSFLLENAHLGIKFGLGPITNLLSSLKHPERAYPSVIVGGTNGKGSIAAMLASICFHAGLKVGLYTSPHLVRIEERIVISGKMITEEEFASAVSRVKDERDSLKKTGKLDHPLTYFELLTASALLHFARNKIDLAILEVGMGGRLDATNVVSPLFSIISQISYDHMQYLGKTIADIAFEKAGIIKEKGELVVSPSPFEAIEVIERLAGKRGAKVHFVSEETSLALAGDSGEIRTKKRAYPGVRLGLRGRHQWENARTAVLAAELIEERGFPVDTGAIKKGLSLVHWEGRLEEVKEKPRLIVDGAHNPAACSALASFIGEEIKKPVILIFAVMGDKEIEKMTGVLFPLARLIILPELREQRAAVPQSIKAIAERYTRAITTFDVSQAVKTAEREWRKRETIIAAGSLYLVGEVKEVISSCS